MTTPTSPEDSTRFVPDSLYNVFAYFSTGVLFCAIFTLLFCDLPLLLSRWKSLELSGQLATVPFILSAVYIYSEFISVMSYHLIRKPVSRIVRTLKPRSSRDFFFDYHELLTGFQLLQTFPDKQRGNYWTLIYSAKVSYPAIGNDLLERHARVKMARMNALNSFLLFFLSLFAILFKPQFLTNALITRSGSNYLALFGSTVLTLLFAFEFYQRQCWFGDIVLKIFASLNRIDEQKVAPKG